MNTQSFFMGAYSLRNSLVQFSPKLYSCRFVKNGLVKGPNQRHSHPLWSTTFIARTTEDKQMINQPKDREFCKPRLF